MCAQSNINYTFVSDNTAGIHPLILNAISQVNKGSTPSYGDDPYTERAIQCVKNHFSEACKPYFLCNGTGANVLALQACLQSTEAVICTEQAHINHHECAAPEKFIGCKLYPVSTKHGKLTLDTIKAQLPQTNEHIPQPKVISLTQPTELGTVYSLDEIHTLTEYAKQNQMYVHMDGARLANAAAALEVSLAQLTAQAGIDVLSFGGTKNGLMLGEAVVFFNPRLAEKFKYIRKQGMQLLSKLRFVSAQFEALLTNDLWLDNAKQANNMAKYLAESIGQLPHVSITKPVETNMVYVVLPSAALEKLQQSYFFYINDPNNNEIRFVTSFDTKRHDVDLFVKTISDILTTL